MILGLAAFFYVAYILTGVESRPKEPPYHCYTVIDENGGEHVSLNAPIWTPNGWYFATEAMWGIAPDPVSILYDRDCLKRKGVPMEPIEEESYQ